MTMMIQMTRLAAAMLCLGLFGCISSNSYVDPQFREAAREDIRQAKTVHRVAVETEFRTHGRLNGRANSELRREVIQALQATGTAMVVNGPADITVRVRANNVGDMGKAVGKGFVTGLTFGAAGSTVTDLYEFEVDYVIRDKTQTQSYKHAIHTTVGLKAAPVEGVAPASATGAFSLVVQDVVNNFVKEMQDQDKLTRKGQLLPKRI